MFTVIQVKDQYLSPLTGIILFLSDSACCIRTDTPRNYKSTVNFTYMRFRVFIHVPLAIAPGPESPSLLHEPLF